MVENFRVIDPLVEGGVDEYPQFILTINGEEYKGMWKDDEINWFNPQPTIEDQERLENEIQAQGLMNQYLQ